MRRNSLLLPLILTIIAHLLLFAPLALELRAGAAFAITALIPGYLLTELLLRGVVPHWERILYSTGVSFGVMVIGMLLVSYIPGPLLAWQTLLFFDGVSLLCGLLLLRARTEELPMPRPSRWLWAGIISLVVVGGFFRFANLGYAEYQGDEARAVLRAAGVIQGYEDVLLLHKKGPAEILVPNALYVLLNRLTEGIARFPFAFANTVALLAFFLLGARLFNPIAGWVAAMLLALDGYFIGFAHIVQYQSIIFLTTILVVLLFHELATTELRTNQQIRLMIVAALYLVTGALSHYEAIWALIPCGFLFCWFVWRQRQVWHALRLLIVPMIVGAALLATFYLPYLLHPNFSATYTYLADRRMGSSFPYNNLSDFFLRTSLYSTTYYVLLMIALGAVAFLLAWRRGLPKGGFALGLAGLIAMLALALQPATTPLLPLIVLVFFIAIAGVWLLPRLSLQERMLWLWLGIPLLVALFFTEKPRTHVYVFFFPWALLVGMVAALGYGWLRARTTRRLAQTVGLGLSTLAIAVFGTYAYWFFVYNEVEILRTWSQNRPAGYFTFYDTPDDRAVFGFPLANGWKVVGSLYEQGVIEGDYETNEKEAWVPAWYTRGANRCARSAEWYFQIDNLESFDQNDRLAMDHYLRQGFQEWGYVAINNTRRMVIYQRTDEAITPRTIPLAEWEGYFDARSTPDLPLDYPTIAPPEIAYPLQANLGNEIWLEGYDLEYDAPLNPGDTFKLTLYWRAQQPISASYKVFNQVYFGDSGMQAQRDGYPVCEGRETWRWDPGELITDVYFIEVLPDATPGLYPLYSGMYLEETGERLPILDDAGNVVDTQVHVTDIRIGTE